jgi:predicted MFS family arabinose efflux permease
MPRSLSSLLWLTLGAFAIGTEGFMIAELLPALARDLNVGPPAAGHLVTAFSVAYAIGSPVMAVLTAGLERRRLLAVAMAGFSLANLLATLAPGYWRLGCCWPCPPPASCQRPADMPPQ